MIISNIPLLEQVLIILQRPTVIGEMWIYNIDSVFQQTVSCFSSTFGVQQMVYSKVQEKWHDVRKYALFENALL